MITALLVCCACSWIRAARVKIIIFITVILKMIFKDYYDSSYNNYYDSYYYVIVLLYECSIIYADYYVIHIVIAKCRKWIQWLVGPVFTSFVRYIIFRAKKILLSSSLCIKQLDQRIELVNDNFASRLVLRLGALCIFCIFLLV